MLLVIYNSNPSNNPELPTSRGWRLYNKEDWASLCVSVDNYFYYLPTDDAELSFGVVSYYSYQEWLVDYQVSEIDINLFMTKFQPQAGNVPILDWLLGTDFYVPDIAVQPDDEPIYPEMDAYA